jgi:uncharacterized protein
VKAIVCDTGPLLAVLNDRDKLHATCVAFFDAYDGDLLVPSLVVTEICYLAQTQVGAHAEARFLDSIVAGEVKIEHPTEQAAAGQVRWEPTSRAPSSPGRGLT